MQKRTRWAAWVLGLALLAWGTTGFRGSWYPLEKTSFCMTCGSRREVVLCRVLGSSGPRAPFTVDMERVVPSPVFEDWFEGARHEHRWLLHSFTEWEGYLRSTADGPGVPLLAVKYERDAGFQAAVKDAVAAGRLTREEAGLVLGFPNNCRERGVGVAPPMAEAPVARAVRKAVPVLQGATFDEREEVLGILER